MVGVEDEYHLFNQVTGLELVGQGEEFLAQVIICHQTVLSVIMTRLTRSPLHFLSHPSHYCSA